MNVIDPAKARSALTLFAVVLFVQAGMAVLSMAVFKVLAAFGSGASEMWFTVQSLLWLAVSIAFTFAVWTLTRALKETELGYVLLGLAGLALCLEGYWVWHGVASAGTRGLGGALGVSSLVVNLVLVVGCCVVVGQLGRTTGFAAAIGAFVLVKTMIAAATVLRTGDERLPMWVYSVRAFVGVGCTLALGALALHARRAVVAEPGAASLPAPLDAQPDASAMRHILAGAALLILGVGGSALSYAAAESGTGGGRYIIATGAIATGLVELVRGLTRLGR